MLGRSIGLTEGETLGLRDWQASELYGPLDRLVLEYVEAVKVRLRVTDDLYARLEERFSPRQIMDLSFTVGIADLINRFHATFQTDVDPHTATDRDAVAGTPVLRGAEEHRDVP